MQGGRANYRDLLADGSFFRFFVGQISSSFGDWVGLIAVLAVVKRIYDNEFAVAAVLLARLAPALFFGPLAGVLVDRFDRKKVMVWCDLARAGLILVLAFIEAISRRVPLLRPVLLLFVISAALEMLTLIWQPAKDSSVPDMVRDPARYTHAYSLLLIAAYGTFPLSGATFGLLANVSRTIGRATGFRQLTHNKELLALFFDSVTFLVSAGLTLTLRIPPRPKQVRPMNVKAVWSELIEGLGFIRGNSMIRSWVLGIGGIFAGIGVFMSLGLFFVSDVLKGGAPSYGALVTSVGLGLGAGFVMAGPAARVVPKDVLFSSVVLGMGAAVAGFGSTSTLPGGLFMGSISGLFGGFAYPTGYALIQEKLRPNIRGRASAAVNSVIRLAVVGAAAFAPALVKVIDKLAPDAVTIFGGQLLDIRGIRVVMWLGGVVIFFSGIVTIRAVIARKQAGRTTPGLFIVFEGGEGAGKSTQMRLLGDYLEARGHRVVTTLEPGGTALGQSIREMILRPEAGAPSDKTEALLYAADRAEHVDKTLLPALEAGSIVLSDRYVDSSVAYQGLGRGLGMDEIESLNRWATSGLLPDLVFLFDVDPQKGLARSARDDRIEQESQEFHEKVRQAFRMLAKRHSERFVVMDGSRPPDQIAAEIQRRIEPLLKGSGEPVQQQTAAARPG